MWLCICNYRLSYEHQFKMNVFQTIHNTTRVFSSLHDAHNKLWLIIKWIKWIIWANSLSCLTDSVNNSESFYWFIRQTIDLFAYLCFEDCKLTIQHCLFSTQHFSLILSVLHSSGFTYFFHNFVPPSNLNHVLLYKSNNALSVQQKGDDRISPHLEWRTLQKMVNYTSVACQNNGVRLSRD